VDLNDPTILVFFPFAARSTLVMIAPKYAFVKKHCSIGTPDSGKIMCQRSHHVLLSVLRVTPGINSRVSDGSVSYISIVPKLLAMNMTPLVGSSFVQNPGPPGKKHGKPVR